MHYASLKNLISVIFRVINSDTRDFMISCIIGIRNETIKTESNQTPKGLSVVKNRRKHGTSRNE